MKYRLIKNDQLNGNEASIYDIYLEEEHLTLFGRFIKENKNKFKNELKNIIDRLVCIGHLSGAREGRFKLKEGKPGDGVCAFYDFPDRNLRVYCIGYGSLILLLGGGGPKPHEMRAFQDDPKLTEENYFMRKVSSDIKQRMSDGRISISKNGMNFEGDLAFNKEEYE
jgi:hypothetical protein